MTTTTDTARTRDTLTTRQRYDLMHAIITRYPEAKQTDADFAAEASKRLGFAVSASSVAHYREGLGVPKFKAESAAALRARVAELETKLQALQQPGLPLEGAPS